MQRQKQVPTHSAVACSFCLLESGEARGWHLARLPFLSLQPILHFFQISSVCLLSSDLFLVDDYGGLPSSHPHFAEVYALPQGTLHVLPLP